jgi:RNA polymerase sigma-70 factor (ECF subfamily)
MEDTAGNDGLSAFFRVRPRLFGIAYRTLGSAAEAEDLVQDVWVRWQATDHKAIQDASAYLATIAARLAVNAVQSARSRREGYAGIRLPEPAEPSADPGLGAQRGEALELAVLLLLERLAPAERAAYILREAFDYPYDEIGGILKVSETNARQMVTRARRHIAEGRRRRVDADERRRLFETFTAAARKGEMARLEALFASDVVSYPERRWPAECRRQANHPPRALSPVYRRYRNALSERPHGLGGEGDRSGVWPDLSRPYCGRARHSLHGYGRS